MSKTMNRSVLVVLLAVAVIQSYGSVQVQMPDVAELQHPDDDLQTQLRDLQRNVSDLWTYIYELRTAVTHHLTHLRQHQIELESAVHRMEHSHGQSEPHTHSDQHGGDHHHSGEHHSHSGEHGEHSHSGEHHSHGNEQHSHSGEQHSHSGEHGHSHSGEHGHSHSGEHGHSHSNEQGHYSHSHSHSHSDEHGHSHHQDHKDSHENEDTQQQTQQVDDPVAEPIVVPTQRQEHYHHHHHRTQVSPTSTSPLQLMNENHHHHHHGHHHHEPPVRSRNRTVVLPKYSEYNLYDFAVCDVQPNRAIPEEKQQDVVGQVTFWQKKMGGPLNLHIRLRGFKIGDHAGHHGGQHEMQEEDNETPAPQGGHRHGFHVHTFADLSNGCQSTGPHYNPKSVNHGGPNALVRHVGDLGNIECDDHGVTNVIFSDDVASLKGQYSIIGKALVIHADTDDLGLGGDEESLKTGNAGTRIACCVIEKVEKIPIKSYKAMKTASHYQNR